MKKEIFYNQKTGLHEVKGHTNKQLITLKLAQLKQEIAPLGEANELESPSQSCEQVIKLIQFIEYCRNVGTYGKTAFTATLWLERFGFPAILTPNVRLGEIETARAIKFQEKNGKKMKGFNAQNAQLIASIFEEKNDQKLKEANSRLIFLDDHRTKTAN